MIASLCLHYFTWDTTENIVQEIRRCLQAGGLLLCRLNSIRDVNYGATGHNEIDRHSYDVDGNPKRFFDAGETDALFGPEWERIPVEEMTINRYEMPKVVWEIVLRKS